MDTISFVIFQKTQDGVELLVMPDVEDDVPQVPVWIEAA